MHFSDCSSVQPTLEASLGLGLPDPPREPPALSTYLLGSPLWLRSEVPKFPPPAVRSKQRVGPTGGSP